MRLRAAAIGRRALLDEDSVITLYRAARDADPTYITAQAEYMRLMHLGLRDAELRREYATRDSASALKQCLMAAAGVFPSDEAPLARLVAIEKRFGPSPCTDVFLASAGWTDSRSRERGARAIRHSPVLSEVWGTVAAAQLAAGEWRTADETLLAGIRAVDDPIERVILTLSRIHYRLARHDSAGAAALWQSLGVTVRREGLPGALAAYHGARCLGTPADPGAAAESRRGARDCSQVDALARPRRAWFTAWWVSRRRSRDLLDMGELTTVIPLLARVVTLAESLNTPGVKLESYTLRGRAYVKAGQLARAVADLTHAVEVGRAAELSYYQAEAYHNLAHAYEGSGQFAEAAAAADSFAANADRIRLNSSRWSSRYDAGTIRRAAGWHAAANRDFDAMVRIVDELGNDGHSFAAEYFERRGQLGRALHYYRIGASLPSPDLRNFAALARVYEALGVPDSAEWAARRHDAEPGRWAILTQPVLPDLLARRGRLHEAIRTAGDWAQRQLKARNVEGAAIAHVRLAELLLSAGEPTLALEAATRADSLARVLQSKAPRIDATTLRGRALYASGSRARGLIALHDAVRQAEAYPSPGALLSTNLALADALGAEGRTPEALAAYDRAAMAVERMTSGLEEDAHRTGYKSRHLAPFDRALRVLGGFEPSGAASVAGFGGMRKADAALAWSVRRKAAALRLSGPAAGNAGHGQTDATHPASRRFSAARWRERLGADEALIDFTVTDSAVSAIVVRRDSTRLIGLRVSAATLAEWTKELRRPLVATPGGQVDLAHATFDVAVADSLYRSLILPLAAQLRGARRLAISPDGVLWYVPFAALVTNPESQPRPTYLMERYELRLLPSAQFLGVASERALPGAFTVEALTYSVPGGAQELSAIRDALGAARVTSRDGMSATEAAALGARAGVLHIAAHGIVDDRDPAASHLRLSPGGPDDGLLHSSEVASRRVAARVVVLTACEAANGALFAGEGLVGLARAFLQSGARQVVASSWPVDASAAALTGAFYRELARGRSAAGALRSAQMHLLSEGRHPVQWAGFVVFGR